MKKLLFIFAAVISLVAYSINTYADGVVKIYKNGSCTIFHANEVDSVVFAPYNNDNDESNKLVGTWIIKNADPESDIWFTLITLKSDGSAEVVDSDGEIDNDYYVKWTVNGNTLRIDLGEGHPDDSLIGTYTLNGNTLTYLFHWKDYDGKWEDDTIYTVVLTKK